MRVSPNSAFIKYELTAAEIKEGSHFSSAQRALIQNLIADSAEEKISLTFDPTNPLAFAQAEAELQGKIGILRYLLSLDSQIPLEV
jgi:hypothetical protein